MATWNDYKPETADLLRRLEAAGFELREYYNWEDSGRLVEGKREEFIEGLTATDEATLRVKAPDGKKLYLLLVLGNSPGELVADYTCHELLDEVLEKFANAWEGKAQPTREV